MQNCQTKQCPKCHQSFICEKNNIENCQCSNVILSKETSAFLSKTAFDCLCKNCLEKYEKFVQTALDYQFPMQKEDLIEDLHYYKENGNWVFTELHHYLRGSCCGNGCRHCVYRF